MMVETWDVEQAVVYGPLDEELEGCCALDRYGVTAREELLGEPLDVALAQEVADAAPLVITDDQWLLVDGEDFDLSLDDLAGEGPEAAALHVVLMPSQ